jgi:hypothetical protein
MQDSAMTLTWLEWLQEKDERNSHSYDFIEAHPVWEKWWFRIGVAVICIYPVLFFWPVL